MASRRLPENWAQRVFVFGGALMYAIIHTTFPISLAFCRSSSKLMRPLWHHLLASLYASPHFLPHFVFGHLHSTAVVLKCAKCVPKKCLFSFWSSSASNLSIIDAQPYSVLLQAHCVSLLCEHFTHRHCLLDWHCTHNHILLCLVCSSFAMHTIVQFFW